MEKLIAKTNKLIKECKVLNAKAECYIIQARSEWKIEHADELISKSMERNKSIEINFDLKHSLFGEGLHNLDPLHKHIIQSNNGIGDADHLETDTECVFLNDIVTRSNLKEEWELGGNVYTISTYTSREIDRVRKMHTKEVTPIIEDEEEEEKEFTSTITLDKIFEGVWALDRREFFQNARLLTWLESISTDDFKAFLKFHNTIILRDRNGKLKVMVGLKPVTKKDISTSILHLRDVCTICDRYLLKAPFGSMAHHIWFLRETSLKHAVKVLATRTTSDVPDYCYYDELDHAPRISQIQLSEDKYQELWAICDRKLLSEMIHDYLNASISQDLDIDEPSDEQIKDLIYNINK